MDLPSRNDKNSYTVKIYTRFVSGSSWYLPSSEKFADSSFHYQGTSNIASSEENEDDREGAGDSGFSDGKKNECIRDINIIRLIVIRSHNFISHPL